MGMGRMDLNKAASIIVIVVFVVQIAICFLLFRQKHKLEGDNKLLLVAIASVPFLAVRVAYGLSTTFLASDSAFKHGLTNVLASAFLQYLMEFVVTTLFLYTGLTLIPSKNVGTTDPGINLIGGHEINGNYSQMPSSR